MKLTKVLLLALGLTLCLAKDANKTQNGHHLVNKTDDKNQTHLDHPHKKPHHLHHEQNEANITAPTEEEAVPAEEATTEETAAEDDVSRLLAGKKIGHFPRNHPQKGKGKNLRGRGHHEKPAVNTTEADSSDAEEDNSTEEAVVAEQGEDAEDIARLLAKKQVRKNKRGGPRRGQKKHGRPHKRPVKPEEVGENAEAFVGEDAEDIEHELRRLAGQIQGHKKAARPGRKGGKKHQRKPEIKPELNHEDFEDFFGEHAFENGEAFDFDHHHLKH